MKKTKIVFCMALVLCLLISAAPSASANNIPDFSDVPANHWAYSYIRACARAGIIQGISDDCFAPEDTLTAEQFITLVGRACYDARVSAATNDGDTWSSAYIRVAEDLELLDNAGIKNMADPIRRCDMATLLFNVCTKLRNEAESGVPFDEQQPANYDMTKYTQAISFCYGAGLLSGSDDGFFHGDGYLTRAQAAKVIALLADLTLEPLYILMYHSVVPDGVSCSDYATTESQFRADLQWMAEHGYTTILPSELAAGMPLPERAVLITFDDGYDDNYYLAFPLLKEFGAKAVIAPVVGYVESGSFGFLNWEMCREMLASELVEIGSHTYNLHRQVSDALGIQRQSEETREAYEERVFPDIETSIQVLESNLGCKTTFFAYPHGRTDEWASNFLQEHFAVTVAIAWRVADIADGLYDLPRYNINSVQTARSILPA